jgi:2-haloacid dehalogenase
MPRDVILFDINETVLDLAPLRPKFEGAFDDAGAAGIWFAMLLHASTVCALTGVETGFGDLAGVVLDRLAAQTGRTLSDAARHEILDGFASLPPHADVRPALVRLRSAGYRTIAFSNSSLGLVRRQVVNAGLSELFDDVVSVEEAGSFKPDPRVYRYAAERADRPIGELRLVAAHDWDTQGALAVGMLAAHLDRSGVPYHPLYRRPDVFGATLDEVVAGILAKDAVGS